MKSCSESCSGILENDDPLSGKSSRFFKSHHVLVIFW